VNATLQLLVIGHGRMGRLVAEHAASHGFEVAGVLDSASNRDAAAITADRCRGIDVAVEFATADATPANIRALASAGVAAVIATTGWQAHEPGLRGVVAAAKTGLVAAPNCSLAANVLAALVADAARRFTDHADFGAWIHEAHHAAKRDAPSGTARLLDEAIREAGFPRPVSMASTRAGHMPGVHEVGFDGPAESLTLTHTVRDRATFAHGALEAARWVVGRRGWFTMADVLGLTSPGARSLEPGALKEHP
jgi:4-hydroxy-tetrahydrodipicolinate reductase